MTLACADDFVAVRLGFANVTDRSWEMTRVIARPSSSFNDYVTPTGDAAWTTFTASNGREDSELIADTAGPDQIVVHGVGEGRPGHTGKVRWSWTNWAPVRSLQADQRTGHHVLMLRALVPSGQQITYAAGQLQGFTGCEAVNLGHDIFVGGIKLDSDQTADSGRQPAAARETWLGNQLASGSLFPIVQFLTEQPGISGMTVGDSHAQGTSTTEQFRNYSYCATAALNREFQGRIPFSTLNCAAGGMGSAEFFARFETLVDAVHPSYAVFPGWTYNDLSDVTNADQTAMDVFFARLVNAVEACTERGIWPIVVTPLPRNAAAMTTAQQAPWRLLRDRLLGWDHRSVAVIDATALVGCRDGLGGFTGGYLASMSDDEMHPNDTGHAAVGQALSDAIKSCL